MSDNTPTESEALDMLCVLAAALGQARVAHITTELDSDGDHLWVLYYTTKILRDKIDFDAAWRSIQAKKLEPIFANIFETAKASALALRSDKDDFLGQLNRERN